MTIPKGMTLFIGAPGSGKTTLCAYFYKKFSHSKKYKNKSFFSNVPILGAVRIDVPIDCGNYLIEDGIFCCDESGIEFNNRNYKALPKSTIQFAKLYRHYGLSSFLLFSQGLDIDITFLRLCDRVCIVRKSIFPFFVFIRECTKYIGIDEITGQLVDKYKFKPFGFHWVFMPTCWKYFDTHETPFLPSKSFPYWDNKTRFITNN